MSEQPAGLSGRKAEAARNDGAILAAAREVFMADPGAPVSAVARAAGVGVGALYRRYASKDVLLQTLCADGLHRFVAIAQAALAADAPAGAAFTQFIEGIVDSDVHALTVRLAGTFTPTPELRALAAQASGLGERIFRHARDAGVLRADVQAADLPMLLEQLTAIRLGDPARTAVLRRRYLTLLLDGLRPAAAVTPLPGPPPGAGEATQRWRGPGGSPG
jgi:AcrR family transcriptional regulator